MILLLSGCNGIVIIPGSGNDISINNDKQGGSAVDVKPETSWGNVGGLTK